MDPKTLALQKIALRCKTDLYFLCREILDYTKMVPHTHQELCDYTTSILTNPPELPHDPNFDPRKNMLLLLMPRGTFKSSVVTIGFTLQFLLNEPNGRVLIDSETYSKAKTFLAEIKGHLESNEKYREVFRAIHGVYPDQNRKNTSIRWTDAMIDLASRTRKTKEPSVMVSGIDKSINGMHYDLIIADDLHSEQNTTGPNAAENIQKVIDHYKLSFSLLEPGKPMIVIGTRWHMLDLYQHIIDTQLEDFNYLKKSAYNPDGSLFFPEELSEKKLETIKKVQGTSIFSRQYLNEPISDQDADFKRESFIHMPWEQVKLLPINWYLLCDPSYSDPRGNSNWSDFAAFVIAGMDYQRKLYVRYVKRAKMTYGDIINELFRIYTDPQFKDLKINRVLLEVIGTKSLSYELSNEMKTRNTFLPLTEIRHQAKSKEERIRALAPFYEFQNVVHVKECPQIEELELELIQFPGGRHDDVADCFSSVLTIASPPTNKSVQSWEERSKKRVPFKPRSPITGY